MNIPAEPSTAEYWAKVESEPRRPNNQLERMVLAGWEDWDGWELFFRDAGMGTDNWSATSIYSTSRGYQYILRRKVVEPRRWENVTAISRFDGRYIQTKDGLPQITVIELLHGWQVVPPDSAVLSKEQVAEFNRLNDNGSLTSIATYMHYIINGEKGPRI